MECTVKAYKNTGYSRVNRPESKFVFYSNHATPDYTFNAVWVLQDKVINSVRIECTWDQIKEVDYVVIGSEFYFLENVQMLNENVCEIALYYDVITSVGLSNIKFLDGRVVRQHIKQSDDTIFGNILPENWTPEDETVLEFADLDMPKPTITVEETITETDEDGNEVEKVVYKEVPYNSAKDIELVAATFNLTGDYSKAISYIDDSTTAYSQHRCTVPKVPTLDPEENPETRLHIKVGLYPDEESSQIGYSKYNNKMTGVWLFDLYYSRDGLTAARSLGLDSSGLSGTYKIPKEWIDWNTPPEIDSNEGYYNHIWTNYKVISLSDKLPVEYGIYKPFNKKVYTVNHNWTLSSKCSGDSLTFPVHDIVHDYSGEPDAELKKLGDNVVAWHLFCNPNVNGGSYCRPYIYKNDRNSLWANAVKGAQWESVSIVFKGESSDLLNKSNALYKNRKDEQEYINFAIEQAKIIGTMVDQGATLKYAGGGKFNVSGSENVMNGMYKNGVQLLSNTWDMFKKVGDMKNQVINENAKHVTVTPEIAFARDYSLVNYVGNGFYVVRERLSENSMKRLDRYLNMYGYSVDREVPSDISDLLPRYRYNYVEIKGAVVRSGKGTWLDSFIASEFNTGIRFWGVQVNEALYKRENPDKSEEEDNA